MKQLIQKDLNQALKNKNQLEVSVLRGILAVIQSKEKEKLYKSGQAELSEEEILNVVFSETKKREESIQGFEKGNRPDLVQKEEQELSILKKYLPEPLSESELETIVVEAIEKTEAKQLSDIKKVMAEVMPQVKNRARGDQIGQIVKKKLCQ